MPHFLSAAAQAALAADVCLFKFINSHHTPFLDVFFTGVSFLGYGWIVIPLFLAFVTWRTPTSRRKRTLILVTAALLISGLANTGAKELANRRRPSAYFVPPRTGQIVKEGRTYEVHVVQDKLYRHSFPSGHAGTAFAIAALLVLALGARFWPSVPVAALVAYSRVYLGVHFPLDTLVGAVMGAGITVIVWRGLDRIIRPRPAA